MGNYNGEANLSNCSQKSDANISTYQMNKRQKVICIFNFDKDELDSVVDEQLVFISFDGNQQSMQFIFISIYKQVHVT